MKGQWEGEVLWNEEKETLTLEGEAVLEYRLRWPELRGGRGAGRISRGYARMAQRWRRRWRQEVYWAACIDLARCREAARPFQLWTASLEGEMTLWEGDLLSLRWEGRECRGDGRPCRVQWGDVWHVREGAVCPSRQLLGGRWNWKKQARKEILEQGSARQAAGDFFPDRGWESALGRAADLRDLWLTEDGVCVALPQYVIAPGVEGTPVFPLNRKEKHA